MVQYWFVEASVSAVRVQIVKERKNVDQDPEAWSPWPFWLKELEADRYQLSCSPTLHSLWFHEDERMNGRCARGAQCASRDRTALSFLDVRSTSPFFIAVLTDGRTRPSSVPTVRELRMIWNP